MPPGTPKWGAGWKKAVQGHYLHSLTVVHTHGSVMSYRDNYLDLDPTYKDAYGLPLLRMTFDWKDNECKMTRFLSHKAAGDRRAMKPEQHATHTPQPGDHLRRAPSTRPRTPPAARSWAPPDNSVVNRYSAELGRVTMCS